jgi:hypothetical protein
MANIIRDANHGTLPQRKDRATSATQGTSVGSGSRPTLSKYNIESGSATDPKTQGRENQKDPASLK